MNPLSQQLLEGAISDLKARHKPLTVRAVLERASILWVQQRDAVIEQWADHILARVPDWKLEALAETVFDLVVEYLREIELPDDEQLLETVAWYLACLRWIHREERGLEPLLEAEPEAVEDAAGRASAAGSMASVVIKILRPAKMRIVFNGANALGGTIEEVPHVRHSTGGQQNHESYHRFERKRRRW